MPLVRDSSPPGWNRIIKVTLCVLSVLFALAFVVSYFRPFYWLQVFDGGAQHVSIEFGLLDWFYEANERGFQAGAGPWSQVIYAIPRVAGYRVAGYRRTTDGYTSIWMPGVSFEWCREQAGYRRYRLDLAFAELAGLAILYPALSAAISRLRRRRRRRAGRCVQCGYSLTGNTSGTCPECGTTYVRLQRE